MFLAFESFVPAYLLLLAVDILWAIAIYFMTSDFAAIMAWPIINLLAAVAIVVLWVSPLLADPQLEAGGWG